MALEQRQTHYFVHIAVHVLAPNLVLCLTMTISFSATSLIDEGHFFSCASTCSGSEVGSARQTALVPCSRGPSETMGQHMPYPSSRGGRWEGESCTSNRRLRRKRRHYSRTTNFCFRLGVGEPELRGCTHYPKRSVDSVDMSAEMPWQRVGGPVLCRFDPHRMPPSTPGGLGCQADDIAICERCDLLT